MDKGNLEYQNKIPLLLFILVLEAFWIIPGGFLCFCLWLCLFVVQKPLEKEQAALLLLAPFIVLVMFLSKEETDES